MMSALQEIRTLLISRTYTQTKRKYHSNLVHTWDEEPEMLAP